MKFNTKVKSFSIEMFFGINFLSLFLQFYKNSDFYETITPDLHAWIFNHASTIVFASQALQVWFKSRADHRLDVA